MTANRQQQLKRPRPRRGMTLTELLVASTIMVMIAGAMSMLSMTVHSANDHCEGQATAAQHGRVILERVNRSIAGATANEAFPGTIVVDEVIGAYKYPQTLAVWLPESTPSPATRLPLVEEIVFFTTDPAQPNVLIEVRDAGNTASVPAVSSKSSWRTLVAAVRSSQTAERIVLSDQVRTGVVTTPTGGNPATASRGALRFVQLMAPDDSEWNDYLNNNLDWDELSWPLDAYGTQAGMRRVTIQTEVQLAAGTEAETANSQPVPFFGSAAVMYRLDR
jgi:prepilin-type N-terminal cleavage/methylation domain-containing protein